MFGRLKIMSLSFTLTSIFEILLVAAVIWAIFHEDTLIVFEKRLLSAFRRRKLRVVKSSSCRYSNSSYIYNK